MPPKSRSKSKSGQEDSPVSVVNDILHAVASLKETRRDMDGDFACEDPPEMKKAKTNVFPVPPAPPVLDSSPVGCDDATPVEAAVEHCVFLIAGGANEVVRSGADADSFRNEWGECILSSQLFPDFAAAKAFAGTLAPSPPSTPVKAIINVDAVARTPMSASSEAKLTEMIASLQQKKPGNRINLLYRTNCASHACVLIIECLNLAGKHQWNVKPEIISDPMQMFAKEFPEDPDAAPIIADDVLAHCFYNIKKRVLRDMSAGPEAPLQVKWTSPDKSREITYDQHVLSTNFTIPVDMISSHEEEEKFIVSKLQMFGASFKRVLSSPLFARLHEANCPKESIWKSMNGKGPKSGGFSFLEYINDSTVHVSRCENLNSHVTKEEADSLMTILWNGRSSGSSSKY